MRVQVQERHRKHWMTDAAIPSFVIQLFLSTVGSTIAGIAAILLLAMLAASLGHSGSSGSLIDRAQTEQIFILGADPYYLGPIFTSLILGFISHRAFHSRSGAWVWVLPTIILVVAIATWGGGGYHPDWKPIWNDFFGAQPNDISYSLFATLPFYTSAAYSFGWLVQNLMGSSRAGGPPLTR